jgi:hypothetical protein
METNYIKNLMVVVCILSLKKLIVPVSGKACFLAYTRLYHVTHVFYENLSPLVLEEGLL